MRVLLTGGTGFVGSHAAGALAAAGHHVRLLVRDPRKLERVFAARGEPAPEHRVGDVADRASVERALEGCDAVVHAAAVVAMAAKRAREVLETNARGVENVVGGAARAGVRRIVYVSSVGALFRPHGPAVTADAPVVPASDAYARSKSDAERAVRALQERGAPIATVYPTAVLGPDDPGLSEANHALRTFARDVVLLTSGGFQLVDVRDVAWVVARLLERAGGASRHVVGGHFLRWSELADRIDEVTGARVRRLPIPGSVVRLGGRVCDVAKRVRDFDFPMTREGMIYATQWRGADSGKTVEELSIRFRDPRETLADALRWMHRVGHIPAGPVGVLARR
jgi:nucleoside-diphosphate-sugar epimerase